MQAEPDADMNLLPKLAADMKEPFCFLMLSQ